MTNFRCIFCEEKIKIPPEVKKKINPITHQVWHEECVLKKEFDMTDDQREFYMRTGHMF